MGMRVRVHCSVGIAIEQQQQVGASYELNVVGWQHATQASALVCGIHPTFVDLLGVDQKVVNLYAVK